MTDALYIVVPCYNEEAVLPETARRLKEKLAALTKSGRIGEKSRILFVDDGSKDASWEIIAALSEEDPIYMGVKLSRNRGHQNALLAGLMTAKEHCDMAISMDADLQDDVDAVDAMVEAYHAGNEIVYGVRSSRKTDTAFKRNTAQGYYRFMHLLGVDLVYNHADYRLMSKRALDALEQYKEVNLFLRGIVPQIGFSTATVEYARGERFAGESKYPLKKMLALAFDGITSFSVRPIRLVTVFGCGVLAAALCMILYSLIVWIGGWEIFRFSALFCSLWLFAGAQLLATGIVGEYVGKVYGETKARPKYLIETIVGKVD